MIIGTLSQHDFILSITFSDTSKRHLHHSLKPILEEECNETK